MARQEHVGHRLFGLDLEIEQKPGAVLGDRVVRRDQRVGFSTGKPIETIGPEQDLGHIMVFVELRLVAEVKEPPHRRLADVVLTGPLAGGRFIRGQAALLVLLSAATRARIVAPDGRHDDAWPLQQRIHRIDDVSSGNAVTLEQLLGWPLRGISRTASRWTANPAGDTASLTASPSPPDA